MKYLVVPLTKKLFRDTMHLPSWSCSSLEKTSSYHTGCTQQQELTWMTTAFKKATVAVSSVCVRSHQSGTVDIPTPGVHPNHPQYTCSAGRPPPTATLALASLLHLAGGEADGNWGGGRTTFKELQTVLLQVEQLFLTVRMP